MELSINMKLLFNKLTLYYILKVMSSYAVQLGLMEKLSNNNYKRWLTQITPMLHMEGVFPHEDVDADPKLNGTCLYMIHSTVTPSIFQAICALPGDDSQKSTEVWKKLSELGGSTNYLVVFNNICRLLKSKRRDKETVEKFVTRVSKLRNEINCSEILIDDRLASCVLLNGLEQRFSVVKKQLDLDPSKLTFNQIRSQLCVMEDEDDPVGYRGSVRGSNGGKIECYNCGRKGHKAFQCKLEKKADQVNNVGGLEGTAEWLLDSACTDHMTDNFHILEDFEVCEGTVVLPTSDVVECQGYGMTNIRFGRKNFKIRVKYVPSFGKSLLSTSKLSLDEGLSFKFDGGGCDVILEDSVLVRTKFRRNSTETGGCLLYTSDAADE